MEKKKSIVKRLKATLKFDKKTALKLMPRAYYISQAHYRKNYNFFQIEKFKLSTPKWEKVTKLIQKYKEKANTEVSTTGKILLGIFNRNKSIALGEAPFKKNTNLVSIIARTETLLLAYKKIAKNKGALTKGANVDPRTLASYDQRQRLAYYKKNIFPDGLSLKDIENAGYLILKGKYPWGSSRRVWIPKPGTAKLRPLTIPPFLDRVAQEAIKMVLYSIWEPDFETLNRSMGFRPNKSCHDAIAALTSYKTIGLNMAIEGDIESAYDRVDRPTLIKLLEKKIEDKKFINMIRKRLNYDYVDKKERTKPNLGIPQGGIDSPYLFNIYMHELDLFVNNNVVEYLNKLNFEKGTQKNEGITEKQRKKLKYKYETNKKTISKIKAFLSNERDRLKVTQKRNQLFTHIKISKVTAHKLRKMPYLDPNRKQLRLFYIRYADDWIILSNINKQVATKIKEMIKEFLATNLKATLSEAKTEITDITKKSAHFLGFELTRGTKGRLVYINGQLKAAPASQIKTQPDKQRIINKLYTKGLCNEKGFPLSLRWLSPLEASIIIERFNGIIRGLMQYYGEWCNNNSISNRMSRWIYVVRYSCLKTLAQKYRLTISKVLKKFGVNLWNRSLKTIQVSVETKVGKETYEKKWTLLTYKEIRNICLAQKRKLELTQNFMDREKKIFNLNESNRSNPVITEDNFLDAITWVSWRTQAKFDLPCALCGNPENVEMHHVKHVRKVPYNKLTRNFERIMSLRNRKSIPVCKTCHMDVIHAGKYCGDPLQALTKKEYTLIYNRITHIETLINPSKRKYYAKSLAEKGWTLKAQK